MSSLLPHLCQKPSTVGNQPKHAYYTLRVLFGVSFLGMHVSVTWTAAYVMLSPRVLLLSGTILMWETCTATRGHGDVWSSVVAKVQGPWIDLRSNCCGRLYYLWPHLTTEGYPDLCGPSIFNEEIFLFFKNSLFISIANILVELGLFGFLLVCFWYLGFWVPYIIYTLIFCLMSSLQRLFPFYRLSLQLTLPSL